MAETDKAALIAAGRMLLDEQLDVLTASAAATRAGAVHEESRPENDKDTRGLEASYLARGQAQRVDEVRDALQRLRFLELRGFQADDLIQLSALVTLDMDGEPRTYFLVPAGGGVVVDVGQSRVHFITPTSPLGSALIGKGVGDSAQVQLRGRRLECEIVEIR